MKQQIESQILTYRQVVGSFYIIDKYFKPFGVSEERIRYYKKYGI